ncbi:MAG: hypothetical protein ACJAZ7_000002 [Zhongshania aliphaticivorans]|jgi:hypothetical protein
MHVFLLLLDQTLLSGIETLFKALPAFFPLGVFSRLHRYAHSLLMPLV